MKYRIDTLHKRNGKEVYMVSRYLNAAETLSQNAFPGKFFKTKEEAINAAEAVKED